MKTNQTFADVLSARDPRDPCPTCDSVGGYCGGENHPSCGLFSNGRPISHETFVANVNTTQAEK